MYRCASPPSHGLDGLGRDSSSGCTGGCTNAEAVGVKMSGVVARSLELAFQMEAKTSGGEVASVSKLEKWCPA